MKQEESQAKNTFISWTKQIEIVCKHLNLWGVFVNASDEDAWKENEVSLALQKIKKQCSDELFTHSVINGDLVTFDNESEAQSYYAHFNETPLDSSCVYAAIISPEYGFVNENT